jgi:hypothetical protein
MFLGTAVKAAVILNLNATEIDQKLPEEEVCTR